MYSNRLINISGRILYIENYINILIELLYIMDYFIFIWLEYIIGWHECM